MGWQADKFPAAVAVVVVAVVVAVAVVAESWFLQ